MQLLSGQSIVFIGDSITDCGRRLLASPYGNGYVSLVHSLLAARHPEVKVTIINRGVSGDTTRDLLGRWERDAVKLQPDWLSLMIGINDVWRAWGNTPQDFVPLEEYTANLRAMLDRLRVATRARLILCTPYMIEPDKQQPMRHMMDEYSAVVHGLAHEYDALLVPTQQAFDEVLAHTTPADWSEDHIHPTLPGHAVIALAWLRTVGFTL